MDPELRKKYNERGSSTDNAQEGFVSLAPLTPD
jgi:hypothetical protein